MSLTPPDTFTIRLVFDRDEFTGNDVLTQFTLTNDLVDDSELVFVNGLFQRKGATKDYTISGKVITFPTAPSSTDEIDVWYVVL
jgi:hypothetical protein